MKIAFLEYRPWVLWDAVAKLKGLGIGDIAIIYYHGDRYDPEKDSEVNEKCESLGVELKDIENLGFESKLDELYAEPDMVFFFHLSLPGDRSQYFGDRINVVYAKKKQDAGENRIWFYTTAGVDSISLVNRTFDDHCIPVLDVEEDQYIFDYEYIKKKVLGLKHG
ncbi:MAG: hypothetical protein NC417_00260 [Candidatus Gastranaerophilales bacterium]|nr:hypothetical protein [Candidatus Gastranaerophilales bacterium]